MKTFEQLSQELLTRLGRRVRLGIVGGGSDSVIGSIHLLTHRVDGLADLVAGAMSIDPAVAESSAASQLIEPSRRYTDWRIMLESERNREDGIDAVVIATPPQVHAEPTLAFLEAGISVFCEKPLASNLTEAKRVEEAAAQADAVFAVNHCYSGYPMVRHARQLVASGALGEITLVEGEYGVGVGALLREPEPDQPKHWHFRPGPMGKAVVLGELGSHLHHLSEFVTGQHVESVSADLQMVAPGREVYDNAYLNVRYNGGAVGRLWSSYVAAGQEHGLQLRVYGSEASLRWCQESPEQLWVLHPDAGAQLLTRGSSNLSDEARLATRVPAGHPEGYVMAFAVLYREFFHGVLRHLCGEDPSTAIAQLPTSADGVRTLRLIEAAERAHQDGRRVELDSIGMEK
ncbi:Gfo/Idh/MocA family protein [Gulosibacter chungangensis]|uniref:Gfo/Idh/MocA family oxidoreductase n=1 Tax=Gulosibacter chungangensis TaxID=979746 RepID=A0A7J5BBB1_9MICO|nr:Gfo/Idh/MocA family oxidoreductase [Gulosibacter chungangensis]KAB1642317.1 Gfo/Idh/MocA family oxidoreductase [Gulosibacter chungangensis]